MNGVESGAWWPQDYIRGRVWSDDELSRMTWDSRGEQVWIPDELAARRNLDPALSGPWDYRLADRERKQPNDRGVVKFLASVCREQVVA